MIKSKIKSKKGYVITYEAVLVAFIFLSIFYVGSMAYTHNFLTFLESKKDIDVAHKSTLLKDYYLKKYSFPGDYYERDNFTNDIIDRLNDSNIKTYDLYSNFSEDNGKMYFRIYSNQYDKKLANASIDLTDGDYAISAEFDTSNITLYTNVANKTKTINTLNNMNDNLGNDFTIFNDVAYIPLITLDNNSPNPIGYKAYGSNGDIIYFYIDGVENSFSARILIDITNRFGAYSNWKYASPISIHNNVNSQLTDYAVKTVFDSSSYIADGEMNNHCEDIRFLDKNGGKLDYWIEPQTINTTHTIAWVKMNLDSNEYTTIYMLYGNPTATSESNGKNTFKLFDDFSEGIDTTIWNTSFDEENEFGAWDLFGGDNYTNGIGYNYTRLNYSAYNGTKDWIRIYSKTPYESNNAMKSHMKFYKKYEELAGFYYGTTGFDRQIISNYHWGGEFLRFESSKDNDNNIDYSILPSNLYDTWKTYEIQRNGLNSVNLIIDDDEDESYQRTEYISSDKMPISFVAQNYNSSTGGYAPPENDKGGYIDIDWVFIRQYTNPEPEVHNNSYDIVFSVNGKMFRKNMQTAWFPYDDINNELKEGLNEIRILHSNYPVEFNLGNGNGGQFQTITFSPRNITMVIQ